MFLVEKVQLTSHFKLIAKKPSPLPKGYQLAARSFDDKVIFHLKTLISASDLSNMSISWMTKAVSFLSKVHFDAQDQISNLRSESDSDYYQALYMDYSQKVLDLSNLISSAVQRLVERRLLLNLSLRLLKSKPSSQISSPEKISKAKDALVRSVEESQQIPNEKAQRAKDLVEELTSAINSLSLPEKLKKTNGARDLIRRTLLGLGALTVFISSVLVSVLYGQSDPVEIRVPAEFLWADSVNAAQKQILDLIKPKQQASDGGERRILLEVEATAKRALAVRDMLEEAAVDGGEMDGDRLEDGVKELSKTVAEFSDGVDALTNGVNGLFSGVLKTRNGVLDGVRKCDW